MAAEAPVVEPEDGGEADETGPCRRCIVTGERLPRERLIRFVVGPEGDAVPDLQASLPGRGLWVTASRDAVTQAVRKRLFGRAARTSVEAAPDLADRVAALLAVRCRDTIGLARRAGQAVAGFEKVQEALRAGPAGIVLAASDGGEDGRRRVAYMAGTAPVVAVLTAAELGQAFGRERAVHAMLRPGTFAARLGLDAERLAGFRGFPPDRRAPDGV